MICTSPNCSDKVQLGYLHCLYHRVLKAQSQRRWRANTTRCKRCGGPRLSGTVRCASCLARDSERAYPHLEHDTAAHAAMYILSHRPYSQCELTGLTASDLEAQGDELTIDRIDSNRGYTADNMRLLSRRLNRMKAREPEVAEREVERLLKIHRGENLGDFD